MKNIVMRNAVGSDVTGVENWPRPKQERHWKDGRSAKELAKAWFRDGNLEVPAELEAFLKANPVTESVQIIEGVPELVTQLPVRGEGRNHDLWLKGKKDGESVTICIEAKADEAFGEQTIAEYRAAALRRRERGETTNVPERISALIEKSGIPENTWSNIRYQLLTAMVGTLIQAAADDSSTAILLIHEFRTHLTSEENLKRNQRDLDEFARIVLGEPATVENGTLLGPVDFGNIQFYIGKVTTHVESV